MTKFSIGQVVITRNCKQHMEEIGETPLHFLMRHIRGDWGDLGASDKKANEQALEKDLRIVSRYTLKDGSAIYVITEYDRSYTTIMGVEEY